jgi:LmbE family N-acetylglucosaminyl deacetylase
MRTTDVSSLGTILSIWAHPDDETYLAAGLMAAARDHGQRVVCVSATLGERGTPDPATWPELRLGPVRRWESAAAMSVLGVHEHHILGLPDGDLDAHEGVGLAWAARLIDHVRPDTILTFGPDGITFHPDHIAVHRWVTQAWTDGGCQARLLYAAPSVEHLARFGQLYERWDMYMSDERPAGVPADELAVHVRLREWELDRKVTALRAMASQTTELIVMLGADVYAAQVAEESFVDARTWTRRPLEDGASVG